MTTFTVWKFDDVKGAEHAYGTVEYAARDGLVKIVDHAIVSWPEGADRPDTRHSHDSARRGTGWGAFWGVLIGSMFLVPVAGAAIGAGLGALTTSTEGTGITGEELERIRAQITPGTSALFLVTDHGNLDRLGERMHGLGMQLIATNLTEEERDSVTEALGSQKR